MEPEVSIKPIIKSKKHLNIPDRYLEISFWLVFIFSIMVKCFYFQFTTQLNRRPFLSDKNIYMLIASLGIILFIAGLILLISNKKRFIVLFLCNLFLSALLLTDTNFFRYYYGIITIPVVLQVDIKLFSSVDQSIMSLFKIKDIIYILDIPFLLAGAIYLKKKIIKNFEFPKKAIASLLTMTIGFSVFFIIYKKADIHAFAYNSNYVTGNLGVLYSHFDTIREFAKDSLEPKTLSIKQEKDIQSFFNSKQKSGNAYKGFAEGKNLIMVQIEAMQQFVINKKVNGKEITPNLNKLIKESLYFDNFYFQVSGGNTSDAEFLSNNSLYPAKEGAAYVRFPENTYYSMPKALKEKGYNTYALHAFNPDFWNRKEMYKSMGFDKFLSCDDYELDDFMGWESNALSDESFFIQSLDKIDTSKPFYSFFITLSSHHPFNFFEDYDALDTGEYEGTYLGNYFKAANYADYALGMFIDELKSRGLYDNSLLALYGDHSAVPKHLAPELMEFLQLGLNDLEWTKLQKVPLIIHCNGLKNGEVINITGGEIDLYPTIANLMNIPAPYVLGKDLLNTKEGYVILRNGSIITDNYIYLNNTRDMYDIKSGNKLKEWLYKEEISSLLKELYISDIILEKDALKNLTIEELVK